jgi:hypothetical protein
MGEDEAHLIRLWREKRGEIEPEDLTDNLIVQLGRVTEGLNRRWYQRNTGHAITDVQRRIQHPAHKSPGFACGRRPTGKSTPPISSRKCSSAECVSR